MSADKELFPSSLFAILHTPAGIFWILVLLYFMQLLRRKFLVSIRRCKTYLVRLPSFSHTQLCYNIFLMFVTHSSFLAKLTSCNRDFKPTSSARSLLELISSPNNVHLLFISTTHCRFLNFSQTIPLIVPNWGFTFFYARFGVVAAYFFPFRTPIRFHNNFHQLHIKLQIRQNYITSFPFSTPAPSF